MMNVTLKEAKDGVGIVKIVGRLDSSNQMEFKKIFIPYLKDYSKFVFDCTELDFVDSSGLGALISCLKNASKQGGDIYIANIQSKPRMLFEITRAYKVFDIFDDLQIAIDAM